MKRLAVTALWLALAASADARELMIKPGKIGVSYLPDSLTSLFESLDYTRVYFMDSRLVAPTRIKRSSDRIEFRFRAVFQPNIIVIVRIETRTGDTWIGYLEDDHHALSPEIRPRFDEVEQALRLQFGDEAVREHSSFSFF